MRQERRNLIQWVLHIAFFAALLVFGLWTCNEATTRPWVVHQRLGEVDSVQVFENKRHVFFGKNSYQVNLTADIAEGSDYWLVTHMRSYASSNDPRGLTLKYICAGVEGHSEMSIEQIREIANCSELKYERKQW